MRPVSEQWERTIRGSHNAVFWARAVAPGQTGTDPDGTDLSILGGDVRLDATAKVRSTVPDLTVAGRGMWPTRADDPLAPYGQEIHLARGVTYGNGSTEWVSLGYHRIADAEQDRPADGPIQLACQDRMAGIVEARFIEPVQFAANSTLESVVEQLVHEVYPWAVIEWDDTTYTDTLGRSVIADSDDRYKFLDDLLTSRGKVWWWDHRGVLRIASPPDPDQPVWEINHGAGGVLVSLSRRLSRDGVYNAVVATSAAGDTTTPVRAVAVDANPNSPTWWGGRFGKVPRFYSSPFITEQPHAVSAAESILRRGLGLPYSVDFASVPNPALEPLDPVRVVYPGRSELHVIESVTVPLTVTQPMTATTREQTVVLIGGV